MAYKYITSIKILSCIPAFKDDKNQGAHLAGFKVFKISFLHGLWILKQSMHDPRLLKKRYTTTTISTASGSTTDSIVSSSSVPVLSLL